MYVCMWCDLGLTTQFHMRFSWQYTLTICGLVFLLPSTSIQSEWFGCFVLYSQNHPYKLPHFVDVEWKEEGKTNPKQALESKPHTEN